MQAVFLINNTSMNQYDLETLKKDYDVHVIGVFSQGGEKNLDDNTRKHLRERHVIECQEHTSLGLTELPFLEVEKIYLQIRGRYKHLYVCASDEINCLTAARLREKYGLGGAPLAIIERYRNKLLQKKILRDENVNVPLFFDISAHAPMSLACLYKEIVSSVGKNFIIKPRMLAGTFGVTRIESYTEFLTYARAHDLSQGYQAEQYIDGRLYHVDLIVNNGRIIFEEACEYLWNGLAFLQGKNHGSIMLERHDCLRSRILTFAKRANDILKLMTGCVHMEVFVTKNHEIYFLEAAARPAGSLVPRMYAQAHGRSFINAALLCELNATQPVFDTPPMSGFWMRFPKSPGSVVSKKNPQLESSHTLEWFVDEGDVLAKPESIAEKVGQIKAFNHNTEKLRKEFESFRKFQAVTVADSAVNCSFKKDLTF